MEFVTFIALVLTGLGSGAWLVGTIFDNGYNEDRGFHIFCSALILFVVATGALNLRDASKYKRQIEDLKCQADPLCSAPSDTPQPLDAPAGTANVPY